MTPLSAARESEIEPFENSVIVSFTKFVSEPPDDCNVRGNAKRSQLHSFRVAEMFACVAGPASEAVAASQEAMFRQRRVFTAWADEDCRRLDGAVCVARPSVADYQKAKRSFSDSALQSAVLEVVGAADDAPPVFVPGPRFVRFWRQSTSHGWPGGADIGLPVTWQTLQVRRRDAATVAVFMLDGAVKGNLL